MVVVGIVGKPNVGKSTFFKAVTLLPVKIANYPFTTTEPYLGSGYLVIDCIEKHFGVKCNPRSGVCRRGKRYIPIDLIDIPGLVMEAHKGKGLGNKFLDVTRNVDVLLNIIDIAGTTDENGNPVPAGIYDPSKDFEWVEEEINIWFFNKIKENIEKIKRKKYDEKKIREYVYRILESFKIKSKDLISAEEKTKINLMDALNDDLLLYQLIKKVREIGKPMVYVANKIDLQDGKRFYKKIKEKYPNKIIIPASAYVELGLRILEIEGKIEYIPMTDEIIIKSNDPHTEVFVEYAKETVLKEFKSTGVQDALNIAVFNVLKYIRVWPVANENLTDSKGRILPDVFLLPPGSTLKDLAQRIHSDLLNTMVLGKEIKTKRILKKDDKLENDDVINIVTKK